MYFRAHHKTIHRTLSACIPGYSKFGNAFVYFILYQSEIISGYQVVYGTWWLQDLTSNFLGPSKAASVYVSLYDCTGRKYTLCALLSGGFPHMKNRKASFQNHLLSTAIKAYVICTVQWHTNEAYLKMINFVLP